MTHALNHSATNYLPQVCDIGIIVHSHYFKFEAVTVHEYMLKILGILNSDDATMLSMSEDHFLTIFGSPNFYMKGFTNWTREMSANR